jgi:hypothetical protein
VRVPTGGRKKKLKARVAAIERIDASIKPHVLATIRTSSRYANPIVVALTGTRRCAANVRAARPASENNIRIGREFKAVCDLRNYCILKVLPKSRAEAPAGCRERRRLAGFFTNYHEAR